jgi:hypothetical protein
MKIRQVVQMLLNGVQALILTKILHENYSYSEKKQGMNKQRVYLPKLLLDRTVFPVMFI